VEEEDVLLQSAVVDRGPRAATVIPATVAFEGSSLKSVLRMPEYTRMPLTVTEYKIESGIMDVARR
jgi:hypothetical protein